MDADPVVQRGRPSSDFVICCRGTAWQALRAMRDMMKTLKLTVNETKTHVRRVPDETFDSLGYTFGRHWTHRKRRYLLCGAPSKKRIARVCEKISAMTDRKHGSLDVTELVEKKLNPVLTDCPPACRMRKHEPSPRAGCGKPARPVR